MIEKNLEPNILSLLREIEEEKRNRIIGREKDNRWTRIWPHNIELRPDESEWIGFVNGLKDLDLHERLGIPVPEISQAADHILSLLNRYVEAMEKEEDEKWAECDRIAKEVTKGMKEARHILIANSRIRMKSAHRSALMLSSPLRDFEFGHLSGIPSFYLSLASFLQGPNTRRLGKCLYCDGLFIGPNNRKRKFCPDTYHKDLYWQKARKRKQQSP